MSDKHPIAVFKEINGERKQIGWASPVGENNGRTFERSPGFENESLAGATFADVEEAEKADETVVEPEVPETDIEEAPDEVTLDGKEEHENYPLAGDEGKDSAPLQLENNETVELNAGGAITDVADEEEDEEAEFQRLLEEEQAQAESDSPQTRREARENQEND